MGYGYAIDHYNEQKSNAESDAYGKEEGDLFFA